MLSGLTEGRFPARDGRDPLDARRAMKLAFATTRDLQGAAFLPGLCVARDRVLFVRNRLDPEKDAERAPSPLLADLRQHCEQAGVALHLEAPTLKAYEDDDDGHDLHARRAKDAVRMRTAIDAAVLPAAEGARPVLANFQRSLSAMALGRAGLLTPVLPASVATAGAATTRQVKLHTLMSLLKYANVEVHAEHNLRMKGWNLKPDEAALVDAERTAVETDQGWHWVKAVLNDALAKSPNAWPDNTPLQKAIADLLVGEQAAGRAPPDGWLAPDVATQMLDRLEHIGSTLKGKAFALGFGGKVVYGAARSRAAGQRTVSASSSMDNPTTSSATGRCILAAASKRCLPTSRLHQESFASMIAPCTWPSTAWACCSRGSWMRARCSAMQPQKPKELPCRLHPRENAVLGCRGLHAGFPSLDCHRHLRALPGTMGSATCDGVDPRRRVPTSLST